MRRAVIGLAIVLALGVLVASSSARSTPAPGAPPHLDTWLRIAKCEQPRPGGWGRWGGVDWHQTRNYTYPGGAGMTRTLWTAFRRSSQRNVETMDQATPLEQVWAMYRFYTWAERTYPGAGETGWECSADIGFHGIENGVALWD
jgi:hypothetical protein